jgi:polar amino acid transport system substrate-binding protein
MRIRAGHLAGTAALALVLALAAGCRAVRSGASAPREPLRIGTVADAPPLAFRQGRRWSGIEADLGRAFADRLGLRPVFVALPPDQLVPSLLTGKVDVLMAGLTVTEERRVQIDFAAPYLVVGQGALVRKIEAPAFTTDIKVRSAPVRVAVVEGSAGDSLVARYFPNARRTGYSSRDLAVQAMLQNEADMVVHDAPALWWSALRHPDDLAMAPALFVREEIAWGFRRGSVRLRESANDAFADWQRDGTLEAILRRWIPFSR